MKIKDLPKAEKPYERLELYGASALSDAELIAILLQSGTKEKSSVQVAQDVLLMDNEKLGTSFLRAIQLEDLVKVKGVGKKKAIKIIAAIELGKRVVEHRKQNRSAINGPDDAADLLMNKLIDEPQEVFCVITLNTQNQVMHVSSIAVGTANAAIVTPRDVFKDAIKLNAPKIILVHNHPSGNPAPSSEDISFTKNIIRSGTMLGIEVLDHIVLGDQVYRSLREMGKI